ncbi:MAG: 3'-5' exonuclease [Candidatus Riflebacteria bacterium]|nr:3'-5' exonuclease [Candidatus Riflebacteria bacterium]
MKIKYSKVFWFDTETGGVDPVKNEIITLAGKMEIAGEIADVIDIKIRPSSPEAVSDEALSVNGLTREQIMAFPPAKDAYNALLSFLGKYISKFDKTDKAAMAGYNVHFDQEFLRALFRRMNDKYFGSWFNNDPIDPLPVLRWLKNCGIIQLPNFKLATACEYFGISLTNAHDAQADITATRELVLKLASRLEYFE